HTRVAGCIHLVGAMRIQTTPTGFSTMYGLLRPVNKYQPPNRSFLRFPALRREALPGGHDTPIARASDRGKRLAGSQNTTKSGPAIQTKIGGCRATPLPKKDTPGPLR